jgi:DNA polymerase-3 subunit alpha
LKKARVGFAALLVIYLSDFSTLDGMVNVPDLVQKAASFGQTAMALTDHGTVSGLPLFIKECKAANIKPLCGCEFYFSMGNPDDKVMHLIIYARNLAGYYKLIELNNAAWNNSVKGMFGAYKGVLTLQHLQQIGAQNLIGQTACMAGPASRAVLSNKTDLEIVQTYKALAKPFDAFFIELQDHRMDEEGAIMQRLARVATEYDLPTVMCTDIHYLDSDMKEDHSLYMAMQFKQTLSTMKEDRRGVGYHVMEREEMETFNFDKKLIKKSLDNTLEIADMVEVITLKDIGAEMPKFKFQWTLDQLIAPKLVNASTDYVTRAKHELQVIKKLGFEDYFLAVHDYVNFANMNNVLIGPGRGSAAGSLVNYLLGITGVDPMKYNLSWDRFLNEGRVKTFFDESQFT